MTYTPAEDEYPEIDQQDDDQDPDSPADKEDFLDENDPGLEDFDVEEED